MKPKLLFLIIIAVLSVPKKAQSQNVGIGTATPAANLDVNGTSINKNAGCVIYTYTWTASASGTGYSTGSFSTATGFSSSGVISGRRLINQGNAFNSTASDATNSGVFTAPVSGFYTVSLNIASIYPGHLVVYTSLNGEIPSKIVDENITGNCTYCDMRNYCMIVYLNAGDTHRVLRQNGSTTFDIMFIGYRLHG